MNGDYTYFLNDDNTVGIAVADVIGKGIPAALCMSMIKYGMDSLNGAKTEPIIVLDVINRIVEKSVSDSMFISMFYGNMILLQVYFHMPLQDMSLLYFIVLRLIVFQNFMQRDFC